MAFNQTTAESGSTTMSEQLTAISNDALRELTTQLGALLDYPREDFSTIVGEVDASLPRLCEVAVPGWSDFRERTGTLTLDQVRELYVQTFELSAACTLEVGYHLFGETYKRGEFLAGLRREEEMLGIDANGQLPDFLPLLLRLYPAIADDETRETLRADCLIPALHHMIEKLRVGDNPYGGILRALSSALGAEPDTEPSIPQLDLEAAHA
jgi:nitrate reductase delta subunit